nr:hypothetical transcript [Hymenolepis microstoma]
MFRQAILSGKQSKFCNSFGSRPFGYVGECRCLMLPIDCIADFKSEEITALANLLFRQYNWPKALLMASISPSNADLFRPASAKKGPIIAFDLVECLLSWNDKEVGCEIILRYLLMGFGFYCSLYQANLRFKVS